MIKGYTWQDDKGAIGPFCDRIEGDNLYRGDIYFSIAALKREGCKIVPMVAVVMMEPYDDGSCSLLCHFINLDHDKRGDGDTSCNLGLMDGCKPGSDCPAGKGERDEV